MKNLEALTKLISYISDNKIHTTKEIAEYCDISRKTACNYLNILSLEFDIQTFKGGVNYGGVQFLGRKIGKTIETTEINYFSETNAYLRKKYIDISYLNDIDILIICDVLNNVINNNHIKFFVKMLRQNILEDDEN